MTLVGSTVGVVLSIGFGLAMVPLRSHLSIATAALVLVVPVVAAVMIGGFRAGMVSVVAGFLVYDLGFVPPYGTLTVGSTQDWVALGVYAVVMLLVAQVVSRLREARGRGPADGRPRPGASSSCPSSWWRTAPSEDLLETIVSAVRHRVRGPGCGPPGSRRTVAWPIAASAGETLSPGPAPPARPSIRSSGQPADTWPGPPGSSSDGGLDCVGPSSRHAGHAGLAGLRGRPGPAPHLRQSRCPGRSNGPSCEDRRSVRNCWRRSTACGTPLVGAVSHDLRTPLATMKVASVDAACIPPYPLSDADTYELHGLIDVETDRLTRLVTSLLDMTRFEAGVLEVPARPDSRSSTW